MIQWKGVWDPFTPLESRTNMLRLCRGLQTTIPQIPIEREEEGANGFPQTTNVFGPTVSNVGVCRKATGPCVVKRQVSLETMHELLLP